ncbi:MAG TPA: YifB family Mg chelatase-like AAA ATPase, partial [Tepidiformaceae bacterium]|nr:YifB family Mg chelatase-like AAA ATPase [Tepidiformaceae bacterium]
EGPAYDLAIAAGVLLASGQVVAQVEDALFVGELALNGEVRPVRGMLPIAALAKARGLTRLFVPTANAQEAALVDGLEVFAVDTLTSLAAHLLGAAQLPGPSSEAPAPVVVAEPVTDFADIVGQENAKRAVEVAAAGGHNVILRGPPGSGKTLLARSIPSILPAMTADEALEVTRIRSVAGLLSPGAGLVTQRPFRSPHHTISNAGLVGGGSVPRPGEVTLAHRGVLFLDELPEFDPRVLDVLRQPLEDRVVSISRARQSVAFPASFTLVAALNPCSCGYYGDPERDCSCPPQQVARYQRRISGPLLDRIDLFVDVPRVPYEKLMATSRGEPSTAVAERIGRAREAQQARFRETPGARLNADMNASEVRNFVQLQLTSDAQNVLKLAVERLNLSARGFHRVLKVARTVADLAGSAGVEAVHLAEAVQYRERIE